MDKPAFQAPGVPFATWEACASGARVWGHVPGLVYQRRYREPASGPLRVIPRLASPPTALTRLVQGPHGALSRARKPERVTVAMHITRKQATHIIEEIRTLLVNSCDDSAKIVAIRHLFEGQPYEGSRGNLPSIPPLERCTGEAHSEPFIDNCMSCAPRWGLVGESVVVR